MIGQSFLSPLVEFTPNAITLNLTIPQGPLKFGKPVSKSANFVGLKLGPVVI